jgi:nitrogen regulatory protein PII
MKEVKAIIQPFMLNHVLRALHQIQGLPAVTVSEVRGIDTERGSFDQVVKSKLEVMVPDELASMVAETIQAHAHTGKSGDGRVFIIPIESSIKIRTGEADNEAH